MGWYLGYSPWFWLKKKHLLAPATSLSKWQKSMAAIAQMVGSSSNGMRHRYSENHYHYHDHVVHLGFKEVDYYMRQNIP